MAHLATNAIAENPGVTLITTKITLSLSWQNGKALGQSTISSAPWPPLLFDKNLEEIPPFFALLHPLSPKAHAIAAKAAIAAALGKQILPDALERFSFLQETAKEQGFYFLFSLPQALEITPPDYLLHDFRAMVQAKDSTSFSKMLHTILGGMIGSASWQDDRLFSPKGFFNTLIEQLNVRLSPPLQKPLLYWLKKRMVSFCRLQEALRYSHFYHLRSFPQNGSGKSLIHGARGLIVHQATIEEGQLKDYALNTPTLRHFGQSGTWATCMARQDFDSLASAKVFASLLAAVLDPCVAWSMHIA